MSLNNVAIFVLIVIALAVVSYISRTKDIPMPKNCTDNDIKAIADKGHLIQAIRWYRELHGSTDREAEKAIEEMIKK